jgi:transposase
MRTGISIDVTASDRERLLAIVADRNSPQKHVWRARIVLLSADGHGTAAIMRQVGVAKTAVWRWQQRFMRAGVDGLLRDKTRPSRIPRLPAEIVQRVVTLTLGAPPGETTHWTAAAMAKASGISASSVRRIWRSHGLQPQRMRQFKLSTDAKFAEKLRDIVGLYVDPPAHAVVLSVDEKSQIQALDRTQPGLPPKRGRCGTMTHDYKRHGTTTLFAALNVLDGSVIGRCMQRHRHQESSASSTPSRRRSRPANWCTPLSTTTPPTSNRRCGSGWRGTRADLPFHANFRVLAQRGRGLLRQADQTAAQARSIPLARLPPGRHQPLPRRSQHRPTALPLDQGPRHDHRRRQARAPSVRFHPLVPRIVES